MEVKKVVSAGLLACTGIVAAQAGVAATIITGGEARITLTADLDAYSLGASWSDNADGQPEYYNYVRSSPGEEYTYLSRSGEERTSTASETSGSTYVSETEAKLKIASSTLYLNALDGAGEEIETFAPAVWVAPQRESNDGYDAFTEAERNINFVPTADPYVWEDFENPGSTYTLTAAQVDLLTEENDDLRLCCTHSLGSFEINTADLTIDGLIDDVEFRDFNNDGVNDNDTFHLFDLVNEDNGVFDMALTAELAAFLNFGFSENGFQDASDFLAEWGNRDADGNIEYLSFAEGDIVGKTSFSYQTENISAVPVPASLPLLAAGLGLMGYAGRRRKKQR